MLLEEANDIDERESEAADDSSTESSQENEIANTSTSDAIESLVDDRESNMSSHLERVSINSVELSSSDSTEDQHERVSAVKMEGDQPSIDSAYTKFSANVKRTKYALKQWIVASQSTSYITNVLTALVPRLRVPAA